jgi:hypothetical protein
MTRFSVLSVLSLSLLGADMSAANAAVCAAGVYRAGCVGPRGGVVVHRPVYPAHHCYHGYYWRAGVRVCR